MTHLVRFALFILALCAITGISTACSEDTNCSATDRRMVYCNFYTINPDDIKKTVLKDTLDSLTITAFGTDSIILNDQKNVFKVSLPLRFTKDTTVLVFHYDYIRRPKYADTMYVVHTNVPYFQSVECGYLMQQDILKLTYSTHEFDSIYVATTEAQPNEKENLKIFFPYRD